jgi:hypothetical protein
MLRHLRAMDYDKELEEIYKSKLEIVHAYSFAKYEVLEMSKRKSHIRFLLHRTIQEYNGQSEDLNVITSQKQLSVLLKKIKQFRKQLHEICPEKRMLRENKIYRMSIMTLDIKEKYILTRIVAESDNPIISSEMQHTVDAILARIERAYIDAESASAIGDIYGVVCEVDIADTLSRKIIDM